MSGEPASSGPPASLTAKGLMNQDTDTAKSHDSDRGQDVFNMETSFADLGLRASVLQGVEAAGFEHPTDIQAQLIPPIIAGRDVLGQARTGTGKTAAFGLPMLHVVEKGTPGQVMILVPTRELAMQVESELRNLGQFTSVGSIAIYGGQRISTQVDRLHSQHPEIIVGTPGRIMDLHQRGLLPYHNMRHIILDEVDRMLDIGFREDIRRILGDMPGKPQFAFVSATISSEIESLARRFMRDPEKIVTSTGSLTVQQVDQSYFTVERWDKKRLLKHLLTHEEQEITLVFCRMKVTVDDVTRYLVREGIDARSIHGNMPQGQRNLIIRKLREGTMSVVVASDLAARGLDVSGVSHVVNFDLPEDPEVYIHRIGRTARVGRSGIAWSFVSRDDGKLLTEIEKLANVEIPHNDYPDFKPSEPPEGHPAREEAQRAEAKKDEPTKSRLGGPAPVWNKKDEVDPNLFPGGVAPKGPPKRTLGGRVRTRRRKP